MALIQQIDTNKGPVSYWVIGLLQLDNFAKSAHIRVYGFFDQSYADKENAQPTVTAEITVHEPLFTEFFDHHLLSLPDRTPYGQAYMLLKQSEIEHEGEILWFWEAEDDIGGYSGEN